MLSPTESASASCAPRFAASIAPGPPPVITANPASPIARPVSRARSYSGESSGIRAEPKTQMAGPISPSSLKPKTSSLSIRCSRSASERSERTLALSA